ncbi:hypothetical protein K437DRAFT_127976 [Tilletiaria anomala UBC 951]|uniref:Uncharacterized protein n=1 Tax=Tilletiaria anomala (strain ATCC 24038 / CBS 436.72 / UBC 951) TaxID=1037660 RepID=A0A066VX92_TILAU|nr:uncharacterized protein K437DRAFT_127976 [Tilletiaria anomala UBC 951]KDN44878.1 hypothetical protein K437DRAFT_127976 [Tilletiaria anomala UBC 951]
MDLGACNADSIADMTLVIHTVTEVANAPEASVAHMVLLAPQALLRAASLLLALVLAPAPAPAAPAKRLLARALAALRSICFTSWWFGRCSEMVTTLGQCFFVGSIFLGAQMAALLAAYASSSLVLYPLILHAGCTEQDEDTTRTAGRNSFTRC